MFTSRWQVFRILGIPVNIDLSWLLILLLLTWTLGSGYAAAIPELTAFEAWGLGLITALGFFLCIVLHELGHAVVARKTGIPIRGITLFLFGGVAEMMGEPPSARREFAMAIAGPLVSAVLASVFFVLAAVGAAGAWAREMVAMFERLWMINVAVLVFNLVPAFPLDGGRVLRSILWGVTGNLRRATYWSSLAGRGFAGLLIAWGVLTIMAGLLMQGLWLSLIGLFLSNAAHAGYQQVLIRQMLEGEPVSRFMNRNPIVVPPSISLLEWVEDYVYRYHHKAFPVVVDDHLEGLVSTRQLTAFPRSDWDIHTVAEAMKTDLKDITLAPDADALQALERMQRQEAERLLVTEDGRLVGLISLRDLLGFLNLKLELEGDEGDFSPPRPTSGRRRTPVPF